MVFLDISVYLSGLSMNIPVSEWVCWILQYLRCFAGHSNIWEALEYPRIRVWLLDIAISEWVFEYCRIQVWLLDIVISECCYWILQYRSELLNILGSKCGCWILQYPSAVVVYCNWVGLLDILQYLSLFQDTPISMWVQYPANSSSHLLPFLTCPNIHTSGLAVIDHSGINTLVMHLGRSVPKSEQN